jgi:hypothetical protein
MPINSFWWPLDLPPRVEAAFEDFRARLRSAPVTLDALAAGEVSDQLSRLMARHVGDIMERDGLPHTVMWSTAGGMPGSRAGR